MKPIACVALFLSMAAPAAAKDITVQMKNQGAAGAMVFEPSFVKAMPGDTVHFVPTDSSHNAETISTMLPAGVAPSKGAMNKEFALKVTAPGLYGVKWPAALFDGHGRAGAGRQRPFAQSRRGQGGKARAIRRQADDALIGKGEIT